MTFSGQSWDVRPGSWWRGRWGGVAVPEEVVRKGFLEELWSYNLEDA